MRKTCVLITSEYPYKKAETFLEEEIGVLSKNFDRILIFAISAGANEIATRQVPSNVKAYSINECGRLISLVRGTIIKDNDFNHDDLCFKHIMVDNYFYGKAEKAYSSIIKKIDEIAFNNDDDVVVYSYWLVAHAIAAVKLKNYFNRHGIQVRAVSRAHGYDLYAERNKVLHLPYRKSLLSNLDGVYPCSDNGCNYLESKYLYLKSKIHLARLGTKDYGVNRTKDSEKVKIVTCCSLIPLKRMKLFAEAFLEIAKRRKDVKWICIGDGPEYNEILEIINKNGHGDKVEFKGNLTHNNVIDFYKNNYVDLFCNVSFYEGVPVSIMEAQSFGIPVLATDVGGTHEIVNKTNGMLIHKDVSKMELALAIEEILTRIQKNEEEIRSNARSQWKKTSCADAVFQEWCDMIAV